MSLTELFAHGIALVSVMNAVEALANTDWEYATYGGGVGMVVEVEGIASIPMPADAGAISVAIFLAAAAGAEGVAIADRLKDKNLYYMQWQYNNENQKAIIRDRIVEQLKLFEPDVVPEKTQFADGLLFTGSPSDAIEQDYNQLKMTVSLCTNYHTEIEVNLNTDTNTN